MYLLQDIKQNSVEDKTSSNKTSTSATTSAGSKRNFSAAPTSKLNLSNLSANGNSVKRDWLSKADEILNNSGKNSGKIPGESRRQRKKRLWLERKESGKFGSGGGGKKIREKKSNIYVGDWAYLPDVVLEIIFQYLDFQVRYIVGSSLEIKL